MKKAGSPPCLKSLILLVEQRGLEPLASALRTRRSAKLSYCPTRTRIPFRVSSFKFRPEESADFADYTDTEIIEENRRRALKTMVAPKERNESTPRTLRSPEHCRCLINCFAEFMDFFPPALRHVSSAAAAAADHLTSLAHQRIHVASRVR